MTNYTDLLKTYKELFSRVKNLEQAGRTSEVIDIDRERYSLHRKIEEEGKKHGKDKNDVVFDILKMQDDLSEYDLPEISVIDSFEQRKNFFVKSDIGADREDYYVGEKVFIEDDREAGMVPAEDNKDYVFLGFGSDLAAHVFQCDQLFFCTPEGEERKKRIRKLVEETQLGYYAEIELSRTTHNRVKIYGYYVPVKHVSVLAGFIREHRESFSPAKEYLINIDLNKGWKEIQDNVLLDIMNYDLTEYETYKSILELYKRTREYFNEAITDENEKKIAHDSLEEMYKNGIVECLRKETSKELDTEHREEERIQDEFGELWRRNRNRKR